MQGETDARVPEPTEESAALATVLRTEELYRRPARAPDFESESRTLAALTQALTAAPDTILQKLVESILEQCQAGSAGLSLLSLDKQRFEWPAIAGEWQAHIGTGTPRLFGPCGDVFDNDGPLLFSHPERRYPYFQVAAPAVEEALLVPFYHNGEAVGTLWAIAHNDQRNFDSEDLRMMQVFSRFASAAYQSLRARELELRHRSLFVSTDIAFCIIEKIPATADTPLDFRYLETNPAFVTYSGVDDAVGKTIRQRFPTEGEEWFEIYDTVCRTGVPVRLERAVVSMGLHVDLFAFRMESEGMCRIAVTFRDITESRKNESAMRLSEIRYRRLFESAKDGILFLDAATGRVVDANPFIIELLGYSADEFQGKELWEIGMFRDKSANQKAVKVLQAERYLRIGNLRLESKRGGVVEVEIVANAYQEGEHRVMQCNIRDVTERSRLERKTAEQAEALADVHRLKDEFLAMLSHELRTPLAAISNAVQSLKSETIEPPLGEQARGIIGRKVDHLRHLVDDLLEVSRITTGRVQLRLEQVDFHSIVELAVETARPIIEERGHTLTISLPPEPVWLHGDTARLEQVVVNLLVNAAKYSDDRGLIWLTVELDGDQAVLRVRDIGDGIPPELLPRIFDMFTQAERSLDRYQGGLGIGLCLVQRIVELHGGTVEATSELGKGSEFVVRLPLLVAFTPKAPDSKVVPEAQSGCRVLIVDDDEDTAESLSMLLLASGHEVRMAHDGPAALKAAVDYRPEVMMLDIGLPMMNGFEVAEKLRAQAAFQDTVLVAVTGYGQEKDRKRTKEAGFDYHLVKPAEFSEIQDILVAVAKRRRA